MKNETYFNICILKDFAYSELELEEIRKYRHESQSEVDSLEAWSTGNDSEIKRDDCGNIVEIRGLTVVHSDMATFATFEKN